MWKIVVGFILFAGLALYFISRGGDIDMGGEKHGALELGVSGGFDMQVVSSVNGQVRTG